MRLRLRLYATPILFASRLRTYRYSTSTRHFLHSLPFLRAGETELQYKYGKLGRDLRKFDAEYFKIIDRLADAMDPMGRLLLEKTYEAIVDAGEYARYATACRDTPRCRLESARPDNYTRTYSRISSRLFSPLSAEFSQLPTTA